VLRLRCISSMIWSTLKLAGRWRGGNSLRAFLLLTKKIGQLVVAIEMDFKGLAGGAVARSRSGPLVHTQVWRAAGHPQPAMVS
jgi:hypothetical protein